jgi:hypothetical protein
MWETDFGGRGELAKDLERRPVLKAIGAGAALAGILPKAWTRPVVQSVVVPAHAATSPFGTTIPAC